MAFGILDDHKLDNVPGTGLLSAKGKLTTGDASELKRGTGKYSHVVLIPQPSDDLRDPLNWPRWKKEACFWTLAFTTGIGDTLFLIAAPGYFQLAKEFNASVDEVASSFSALFAGAAAFTLLQIPISVKYGHRIVYLFATFLMFITCVWVALSPNMTSIRAARIFQGIGAVAPRCLVASTIEHLYYVHERGSRSCIWTVFQTAGGIVGLLINGYVLHLLTWQHGFWFASIACGLSFMGVFLFVPETTYHRQASSTQYRTSVKDNIEKTGSQASMSEVDIRQAGINPNTPSASPPTFYSQLKIYNGTFANESAWKIFLGLFPFILSPVTWFACFSASIPTVFVGVVLTCSSTIFTVTYGFNAGQIGLTNIGAIVGIFLAMATTGLLNDWWIIWMSRRNRGIYEPEYRLVFMLCMLFAVSGFVGWAVGNDRHMPWIGAVACLAMVYFSVVVSSATRAAYVIDTHGANTSHIIALTEFVLDVLVYGSTFFVNGIVLSAGVKRTLLVLGAAQTVCLLTCIPMYVFGKRVRSFLARHPRLFRRDLPAPSVPQSAAPTGTGPRK